MREDEKPLEILPWGRTLEQQNKIDAKKAAGRRGVKGCLLQALLITLILAYAAGWMNGKYG